MLLFKMSIHYVSWCQLGMQQLKRALEDMIDRYHVKLSGGAVTFDKSAHNKDPPHRDPISSLHLVRVNLASKLFSTLDRI